MILDTLVRSVREVLRSEGLSVRAAALRAGLPIRSVQNVLDGHDPGLSRAAEICTALGLELYIGPPRAAQCSSAVPIAKPPRGARHTGPLPAGGRAGVDAIPWPVKMVEGRSLSPVGCAIFGESFLSRFSLDPMLCISFRMTGDDSMAPTLPEGSAVLADERRRKRKEGLLYMVYLPGAERPTVRRCGRSGTRRWLLECDSETETATPWSDDVDLVGRVVWTGRMLLDGAELR